MLEPTLDMCAVRLFRHSPAADGMCHRTLDSDCFRRTLTGFNMVKQLPARHVMARSNYYDETRLRRVLSGRQMTASGPVVFSAAGAEARVSYTAPRRLAYGRSDEAQHATSVATTPLLHTPILCRLNDDGGCWHAEKWENGGRWPRAPSGAAGSDTDTQPGKARRVAPSPGPDPRPTPPCGLAQPAPCCSWRRRVPALWLAARAIPRRRWASFLISLSPGLQFSPSSLSVLCFSFRHGRTLLSCSSTAIDFRSSLFSSFLGFFRSPSGSFEPVLSRPLLHPEPLKKPVSLATLTTSKDGTCKVGS